MEELEKQENSMDLSNDAEVSNEAACEIIENSALPNEDKAKLKAVLIQRVHRGPLPSPEILKEYNEIPGMADTIVEMAKSEMEHRHYIEKTVVESNVGLNKGQLEYLKASIKLKTRLQIFSFVFTVMLIICTFICIYLDKDTYAGIAAVGAIGSFCWTMFYGKSDVNKDKEDDSRKDHDESEN